MTSGTAIRAGALASLAVLLLVVGAALRPVVVPVESVAEPVLSAAEIGFVQDMAEHHQQALAMTLRLAPDVDPAVAALARQIGDTQRVEIGTLLGWLRLADAPPTNPRPMAWNIAPDHAGHDGSAAEPGASMTGMASMAELDALSAAHGRDAEVVFLQLMLRHHLGGVEMARAADALLVDGPVKQSARAAVQEQGGEIGLLTVMLAERGATALR